MFQIGSGPCDWLIEGHTICCLSGSSPSRHFEHREDPGDEVGCPPSILVKQFLLFHLLKVLVKIGAAGVNPVDTYIRSGTYARKPALPYTPGSDGAGVVHSVGEGVKQVKVS